MSEMVTWLRAQIEARKAMAGAATCGVPWEAECDDPTDDEVWIDVDGEEWRLVVLRGPQSHENMIHVAANDPQDTIARCEAELAILDEHKPTDWTAYGDHMCRRCHRPREEAREDEEQCEWLTWPCRTARLLGSGYRHRPGYLEEWKP